MLELLQYVTSGFWVFVGVLDNPCHYLYRHHQWYTSFSRHSQIYDVSMLQSKWGQEWHVQ